MHLKLAWVIFLFFLGCLPQSDFDQKKIPEGCANPQIFTFGPSGGTFNYSHWTFYAETDAFVDNVRFLVSECPLAKLNNKLTQGLDNLTTGQSVQFDIPLEHNEDYPIINIRAEKPFELKDPAGFFAILNHYKNEDVGTLSLMHKNDFAPRVPSENAPTDKMHILLGQYNNCSLETKTCQTTLDGENDNSWWGVFSNLSSIIQEKTTEYIRAAGNQGYQLVSKFSHICQACRLGTNYLFGIIKNCGDLITLFLNQSCALTINAAAASFTGGTSAFVLWPVTKLLCSTFSYSTNTIVKKVAGNSPGELCAKLEPVQPFNDLVNWMKGTVSNTCSCSATGLLRNLTGYEDSCPANPQPTPDQDLCLTFDENDLYSDINASLEKEEAQLK